MSIPGLVPNITNLNNSFTQPQLSTIPTEELQLTAPNGTQVSDPIGNLINNLSPDTTAGIDNTNNGLNTNNNPGSSSTGSSPPFSYALPLSQQSLRFPLDLSVDTGIRMGFTFMKYSRENAMNDPSYTNMSDIYLPVPANLSEAYGVNWTPISPGLVGTAIANGLQDAGTAINSAVNNPSIDGIKKAIGQFTDSQAARLSSAVQGNGKDVLQAALLYGVGGLNDLFGQDIPVQGIVQNYLGKILNPSTTVTMAGPQLRPHQFTWTFAPKSQAESSALQQIYQMFRQNSLPTVAGEKYFLEYPMLIQPKFTPSSSILYPFKPCVVTNITINHAGGGFPSFFYDTGAATVMEFTLSLLETKMFVNGDAALTSSDIANLGNTDITTGHDIGPINSDDSNVLPNSTGPVGHQLLSDGTFG